MLSLLWPGSRLHPGLASVALTLADPPLASASAAFKAPSPGRDRRSLHLHTHHRAATTVGGSGTADTSLYSGRSRGLIKRNTRRDDLGTEAYVASLSLPPAQQRDQRMMYWSDASEPYARQLHEVNRASDLAAKRGEHRTLALPVAP